LPFVGMITAATSTVLMPAFSRLVHEKSDVDSMVTLWRNALSKSAVLIYPMVIFFIFNAKNVIVILYSNTYVNSVIYFQIAMIVNFFNVIMFAPLLLAMGETKFYSRVHMALAFSVWFGGYAVVFAFGSPVAIAVFSVSMSIAKIMVFIRYIARLIQVSAFRLFPIKEISLLVMHSCFTMAIVNGSLGLLMPRIGDAGFLATTFAGFVIVMLSTAKWFHLDYLGVLNPILARAFGK
jgi:O-antigen/teichoic acid export membrane protein